MKGEEPFPESNASVNTILTQRRKEAYLHIQLVMIDFQVIRELNVIIHNLDCIGHPADSYVIQ